MGTPAFAVESLKALVENGYNIAGVVTMPDKPAGRGYRLQFSPVKQYALQRGLTVLQPEKLRDEGFLENLNRLKADLQIVVAFRMLPEAVWSMPPLGTFNLHASLLPQYRGAAPINRAIMNGERETGVTTFFLSHEIDTGEVLFRERTPISDMDNAETLHDRLMVMGAQLVIRTVEAISKGSVSPVSQDELSEGDGILKLAPKIFGNDCRIDWSRPVREVYNLVRGLSPYPAAWTELLSGGEGERIRFKLFAGEPLGAVHSLSPGCISTDNKTYLHVAAKDGFLRIRELRQTGKRRLCVPDFLNGFSFPDGAHFR